MNAPVLAESAERAAFVTEVAAREALYTVQRRKQCVQTALEHVALVGAHRGPVDYCRLHL
jgi:hypothetical protein